MLPCAKILAALHHKNKNKIFIPKFMMTELKLRN